MVRYYKELEHRLNYYLPLVDIEDNGKKVLFNYEIPFLFIEKYANLFKNGESLYYSSKKDFTCFYKNFNIEEWFKKKYILITKMLVLFLVSLKVLKKKYIGY